MIADAVGTVAAGRMGIREREYKEKRGDDSLTLEQRQRMKRRRQRKRSVMRALRSIMLMPARLPRMSSGAVAIVAKTCEAFGLIFLVVLISSMLNPTGFLVFTRTVSALAFFVLFFFVKLEEYQDYLEDYVSVNGY